MATSSESRSAAAWAVYLAVLIAVLTAVVLQLVTGTVNSFERVVETGVIVAALLLLSWVFFGGPERYSQRRGASKRRKAIRSSLELTDELWSLVNRTGRIFGPNQGQMESFGNATMTVMSDWNQPWPSAAITGAPRFTDIERLAGNRAQAVSDSWSRLQLWNPILFQIQRALQGEASRDTDTFIRATQLLQGFLNSAYQQAEAFVVEIRQAGVSKLTPRSSQQWAVFAEAANTLRAESERFNENCLRCLNVNPGFGFTRVRPLVTD